MHSLIFRGSLWCAAAALLAACTGGPTEPRCDPVTLTIASVSGDTVTTSTGLRYIEGEPGAGAAAEWCETVAIHYEGFLLDGTRFESSSETGLAVVFIPGRRSLIAGVEQGVVGMRPGGTRRLIIPPELAFGSQDRRDAQGVVVIPANSTVVYDIEVLQTGL